MALVGTPKRQTLGYPLRTSNIRDTIVRSREVFCLLVYIELCQLHTSHIEISGECNIHGSDKKMNTTFYPEN
jgi:hypothetical protein